MSDSSAMASQGRQQYARVNEFELQVERRLGNLFGQVEVHKRIEGLSGVHWRVDFLVNSNLIIEASVQRRLETKINSTFLRFVDVTRKRPNFKAALVLEEIHVEYHKRKRKKYFPTSEYRTMITHGFAIVSLDDLAKLEQYARGEANAVEISSGPVGFRQKGPFFIKRTLGPLILEALSRGPMPRREIAKAIGRSSHQVDYAIKLLPEVKKAGGYFGLSNDEIILALLKKKGKSGNQRSLIRKWLEKKYLKRIRERGQIRTSEFASEFGLNCGGLAHFIHTLSGTGKIKRIERGTWGSQVAKSKRRPKWP